MTTASLHPPFRRLTAVWIVVGYVLVLSAILQCLALQIVPPTPREEETLSGTYAAIFLGFPAGLSAISAAWALRRRRPWGRAALEAVSWASSVLLILGVVYIARVEGHHFDMSRSTSVLQLIYAAAIATAMLAFSLYSALRLRCAAKQLAAADKRG